MIVAKELIDHNKNGFLFSNRNVDDMTETILEILNKDQDALQRIIKNAMSRPLKIDMIHRFLVNV